MEKTINMAIVSIEFKIQSNLAFVSIEICDTERVNQRNLAIVSIEFKIQIYLAIPSIEIKLNTVKLKEIHNYFS